MDDRTLSILAPAKINLYLHVTGRREDGYHLLDSLIAFADCGDRLRIRPGRGLRFSVDGPFARSFLAADLDAGPQSGNLVVKAAYGLAALARREPDADIRLTKNLPLASGLGGGSADAAAALWGLMNLWNLSPAALPGFRDLPASLGADVPACMACRPVRIGGIGEKTEPAEDIDELPVLLVNPSLPCPTPRVFAAFRGPFTGLAAERGDADLISFLKDQRNDLTQAACSIVPEIGAALEEIAGQEGCLLSRLSGSGATCFGLFADEAAALDAAESILRAHPAWWVRAAFLNRAGRY